MKEGRPPLFETVEELQKKIDGYFEHIKGEKSIEWLNWYDEGQEGEEPNKWITEPDRPKITSLCLFLGFESRQSFYDLGERKEFSYTIKKAHMRIEESYENLTIDHKNPAGPIFLLKNLGWKDRLEQDINVHTEKPILKDLTKGE